MSDWHFAATGPGEDLARLHFFSVKKKAGDRDVEFRITIKEFARPKERTMTFFAQADKQVNQDAAPITPCGWGNDLLAALADCIRQIEKFPYQDSA